MKKVLALGMLGLLVAFAMALGTSATFRDFTVDRSTHINVVADDNELIDLRPGQPYAYINDDGKLVIEISKNNPNWPGNPSAGENYNETWAIKEYGMGISPGSKYNFDHIFYVSNHLWEDVDITVRITGTADEIEFFHPDGEIYNVPSGATPTESDAAFYDVCFVLEPGTELGISMEFTGGGIGWQNSTITIKAWPYSDAPADLPKACGGGQ